MILLVVREYNEVKDCDDMLMNVVIENVSSVKERIEVDFTKGKYNFKDNMLFNSKKNVNPIAMFGSNGSGKTVFLTTISNICRLMIENISDLVAFTPFLPDGSSKDSYVKLEFILGKDTYVYEIKTKLSEIVFENLQVKNLSVVREYGSYQIFKDNNLSKTGNIEGKLYSVLRKLGNEEYAKSNPLNLAKKAFQFLSSIVYIDVNGVVYGSVVKQKSIEDIMVDKSDEVSSLISEYKEFPVYKLKKIKLENQTEKMVFSLNDQFLPSELMSNGMRAHSTLLSTILSMDESGLLLIDEIERSLHPFVAKQFIEHLNDKFNVQVIFTSHNTNLLQSLRPDQVFFSKWDKDSSKYMKLSEVYPNIREVNNIEKMYYGGLIID